MGFDSFAKMVGFDDYYGLDQYPDERDFDGIWGVWDEPFFDFFATTLNNFREPFLASVFSISSHHPFKVPEKYKDKFKKGPAPIVEVVGYTDYALKSFFKKVTDEPWFNNTIFIITADHTNESIHKEFQNNFGSYSVPIIFYKSGSYLTGVKNIIAQQIDIMPTILHYLNFDREYIAFGNNLLDDSYESFAFNTAGSTYQVKFEVTAVTQGYVRVYAYVGASGTFSNIFSSTNLQTGEYEGEFEFGGSDKTLRFYGSTGVRLGL